MFTGHFAARSSVPVSFQINKGSYNIGTANINIGLRKAELETLNSLPDNQKNPKEIEDIESGQVDRVDNMLKNAPHTAEELAAFCCAEGSVFCPFLLITAVYRTADSVPVVFSQK